MSKIPQIRMAPVVIFFGGLAIFAATFFVSVLLPWGTSEKNLRRSGDPRTPLEETGRTVYIRNGCTYCHSQFIRNIDWGYGAVRIAQHGDYIEDQPHLLGTERTGPDLSQEGGRRADDWHLAHFMNARFVSPESVMPILEFLGTEKIEALTAYMQSLGFKMADERVDRQRYWKEQAIKAYESGPDRNVEWLHEMVPEPWRRLPNPYPTTPEGLHRGKRIYQAFCIGCHGPIGDGMGPAQPFLYPPPLNFTLLGGRGISGGILYYQIMNGITGTGMPFFKKDLESEKIWDVGDYVAVFFIGKTDGDTDEGIDASEEPTRPVPVTRILEELETPIGQPLRERR